MSTSTKGKEQLELNGVVVMFLRGVLLFTTICITQIHRAQAPNVEIYSGILVNQDRHFHHARDRAKSFRLLPPTARAPFPVFLRWLTRRGGAVGVVAVAGSECVARWLRALHLEARATVLLWRPPPQAREGSAPSWLERTRAALLVTDDSARLLEFLVVDVKQAVVEEVYSLESKVPFFLEALVVDLKNAIVDVYLARRDRFQVARDMQLNSKSRILISIMADTDEREDIQRLMEEKFLQVSEGLLMALQMKHQSTYWVYLQEHGSEENGFLTIKDHFFYQRSTPPVCAGVMCTSATAVQLGTLLNRTVMRTMIGVKASVRTETVERLGVTLTMKSSQARLLEEMENRLRIKWITFATDIVDYDPSGNRTSQGKEEKAEKVMSALHQGKIEFYVEDIISPGIFSFLDTISASTSRQTIIVLVPRATPLPTWSLPLRVWSPGVWLALAGAVWAYALAWRAVAGESLAASAAAALRAFSSCGGVPQDRVRATPQRLQLAAALLASAVVLVSTYQGRLFQLMTKPDRHAEIDSFAQLAAAGLEVVSTYKRFLAAFARPDAAALEGDALRSRRRALRLARRVVSERQEERLLQDPEARVCFVTADSEWRTQSSFGREWERFRPMGTPVKQSMSFIYARRNWPWTDALNLLILQLQSSGLCQWWKDDHRRRLSFLYRAEFDPAPRNATDLTPAPFGLADVRPHLQLLVAGLAAAAGVFGAEVLLLAAATRASRFAANKGKK